MHASTLLIHRGFSVTRWATTCLMFGLVCLSASAAELPELVLNDANSAPFTTEAGNGLVDIVAKEAFRRAGLRLKLVRLPAERALINANAGIEDGEVSRIAGIEKNYPNLIPIPERLVEHHFVALTRHAVLKQANWETLAAFSVGYIRGYKIFESNLKPGTQVITADTAEQLFSMLDKGRIDIALYRRWEGLVLAEKLGIKNIHVVEPSLAEKEIFIYLHKRHADKVAAITAALRAIKSEGLFSRACREAFAAFNPLPAQCASY